MKNGLFMKLFKINDVRLVHLCQDLFHFHLPSELLQQRSKNSWSKYKVHLYIDQCMCHACSLICVFVPLVKFIFQFFFHWLPLYGEINICNISLLLLYSYFGFRFTNAHILNYVTFSPERRSTDISEVDAWCYQHTRRWKFVDSTRHSTGHPVSCPSYY